MGILFEILVLPLSGQCLLDKLDDEVDVCILDGTSGWILNLTSCYLPGVLRNPLGCCLLI